MIQAFILAGGEAKRFGGKCKALADLGTYDLKEMLQVVTILDKWVLDLYYAEVDEIYILAGRHYKAIKNHVQNADFYPFGEIEVVKDKKNITNTLCEYMKEEADKYVIVNGDVVTDVSLRDMLKHSNVVLVAKAKSPFGHFEILDNGYIKEVHEKPYINNVNGGVYVGSDCLFYIIEKNRNKDWETFVKREWITYFYAKAYIYDGFWHSVETPKDLEYAQNYYKVKFMKSWGWVLNLNPVPDLGLNKLYLKKGYETSLHLHKNRDEVLMVEKGKIRIRWGKEEYTLKEEDYFYIQSNKKHKLEALDYSIVYEAHNGDYWDVKRL